MTSKESVLITGCSEGGIGHALATEFQKKGYHVFATVRDVSKAGNLKDLENVTVIQLDLQEQSQITAAVEAVTKATGGSLNYLINNAGQAHLKPVLDDDLDTVRKLFEVNFFGPLALTQAFTPLVIKAKGGMAFLSSLSGYLNTPYMGTYAATKRSLELISETLRLELAPFGVNVTSCVTGPVTSLIQSREENWSLPENSLYKPVEAILKSRAQGQDGAPRTPTEEYATAVADAIIKRTPGKFWYGPVAEMVKNSTTATGVPQEALDAGNTRGTGLDQLGKDSKM